MEAGAVGDRHAEILVGINRGVAESDFIVKMRTGGAAAGADVADGVAAMDVLPGRDREAGKVAVAGGDAVAVVHHDGLAVSALEIREGDHAIGGRGDRAATRTAANEPARESPPPR